MLRRRPPRLRGQSINRLIPNILTLLALCAGLTAVRFGLEAKFHLAVVAVALAGVLDGLDGRIARLIGATSKFGAELDSLSDFVCFGVVPAMLLYLWVMQDAGRIGWAVVLLLAMCMALRLARFNTALEEARPAWTYNYFTGVPAPAGAGLALLPMIASFEFGNDALQRPWLIGIWIVVVAGLTVSRIPTFALKRLRIRNWMVLPILLGVMTVAACLTAEPWLTLTVIGLVYLLSIPIAARMALKLRRRDDSDRAAAATEGTPPPVAGAH